ncbi:MAG: hypothetical protein AB1656_11030, partial [Candidatus Omnitrophota bacterium]
AEIEAMRYEPNRIAFQYAASEPQWLRLAEWDYPGWKAEATLESEEIMTLPRIATHEGLRVLPLPAKTREIKLTYVAPQSGWLLSAAASILFLILLSLAILLQTNRFFPLLSRLMGKYY